MRWVLLVAMVASSCRPDPSFGLAIEPGVVNVRSEAVTVSVRRVREFEYWGPIALSGELRKPDGELLPRPWDLHFQSPEFVSETSRVTVSLGSLYLPPTVTLVVRGQLDDEVHTAEAQLDMSNTGAWSMSASTSVQEAAPGATIEVPVEATGFAVEGRLIFAVEARAGGALLHSKTELLSVSSNGRNNVPIARWRTSFVVPAGTVGDVVVSVRGELDAKDRFILPASHRAELTVRVVP